MKTRNHHAEGEANVSFPQEPRIAQDVYRDYAERHGYEAAQHAVIEYFDRATVVELLLEHMDAGGLEEFLDDNLSDHQFQTAEQPSEESMKQFLREPEQVKYKDRDSSSDRVNWIEEGL